MTLDRTLPPLIPDYMTYSWLSLLRGHDMIIILLLPDIWYSCTPEYLNPWNREAPDITPVLYSCWPRNRITMDIVHLWISPRTLLFETLLYLNNLHRDGEIDGYRYSFCVYGGHKYVVQLPVGFDLEATRRFRGVYWHPYPLACLSGCAIIP